jgi:heme/copper-type cytochrome/quinol oxidase subunit 4
VGKDDVFQLGNKIFTCKKIVMSLKEIQSIKFNFPNFIAFCIVTACFVYFFWISGDKNSENHNIGEIKTALISIVMLIVGYYFGNSKNSVKKDETIQTMTETANNNSKQ